VRYAAALSLFVILSCVIPATYIQATPVAGYSDGVPVPASSIFLLQDEQGWGTAFVVANEQRAVSERPCRTWFLTAAHLVKPAMALYVVVDGEEITLTVAAIHPDDDMALLVVDRDTFLGPPLGLAPSPAKLGQNLFTAGYPIQMDVMRVVRGLASSRAGEASLAVAPGASGSPVWTKGGVVGLVQGIHGAMGHPFTSVSRYTVVDPKWMHECGVPGMAPKED